MKVIITPTPYKDGKIKRKVPLQTPGRYLLEGETMEVEYTSFYARRVRSGELKIVKEPKAAPKPKEKPKPKEIIEPKDKPPAPKTED